MMCRTRRNLFCALFLFFLTGIQSFFPAYAEETAADDKKQITVPYVSSGKIVSFDYPYSDAMFMSPSEEFNDDLVKASLGLTISAFYDLTGVLDLQTEVYLGGAGFQDICAFGYDLETSKDTLAGIIGWKQVGDFILIAAAPRGAGYSGEWAGNLEVGREERHVGFNRGARILEEQLETYISSHNLSGRMKLWLSGFSRAAAVANLTAADMIDSGRFEDVYAYLFGVPRTTKDPACSGYKGIYNICGKNDPVPQVPGECWGYNRYGRDLYTPSQETDSTYPNMMVLADNVCERLIRDQFLYNPNASYQLHMILELLFEMFPTNEEYADKFQDILMSVWAEPDTDNLLNILMEAFSKLRDLDEEDKTSSKVVSEYLSKIAFRNLMEDKANGPDEYWNPRQGLGDNMLREHMPYTYVTWVFSGAPEESLYHGNTISRRISLFGDIDVEVWKNDICLSGKDSEGFEIYNESSQELNLFDLLDDPEKYAVYAQKVFVFRDGNETVISLPVDNAFDIVVRPHGVGSLVYYDIFCTPEKTYGQPGKMYSQMVGDGEYRLHVDRDRELPGLRDADGRIVSAVKTKVDYSPVFVMANESSSKNYAKIDDIVRYLIITLLVILVTLLGSLIIAAIHSAKKKKNPVIYSPLYVIFPHMILIIQFALMNLYVTRWLYSVGIFRIIFASLALFCTFLLALRGCLRNRCKLNIVITGVVLAAALVDMFVYQRSAMVTSSRSALIIYLICIFLLTVLAAGTFFIRSARRDETD